MAATGVGTLGFLGDGHPRPDAEEDDPWAVLFGLVSGCWLPAAYCSKYF